MLESGLAVPMLILSGLLLLATSSAILLKKLRFPYTIGLVVIGMLLGVTAPLAEWLSPVLHINLSHDLILYILLPVLIYDAAINIKLPHLIRELAPVLNLAIVGVVLAMLIVAIILERFTPLTLAGALLFGALISATDPVAVIALFKEIGAPERMSMLMDSESLFNDATAIVIFGIVVSLIQSTASVSASGLLVDGVLEFTRVFFGGIIVGSVIGVIMLSLIRMTRSIPFAQLALTTVLAYGSFIIADHFFGVSGVMSTIAAGLITRSYSSRVLSEPIQQYMQPHWEFMAFIVNSLIFLLLGMKENLLFNNMERLQAHLPYLIVAILAVLLARWLIVYLLIPCTNRLPFGRPVDGKTKFVMFWGGLRGVVPIALMLSLPEHVPYKDLIINMTLGVILFSLLVQGTTVSWLMRKLKITPKYHVKRPVVE